MKFLFTLILLSLTMSCGSEPTDETTPENAFNLAKDSEGRMIEKNWGDGGLILNEEKLVLITRYVPSPELGSVSLPRCAELDESTVVGKFICNTDKSIQEIKVKNTEQVCQAEGEQPNVVPAKEELSSKNCLTGRVVYYESSMAFGHTIVRK